jgi:hypothetical protein
MVLSADCCAVESLCSLDFVRSNILNIVSLVQFTIIEVLNQCDISYWVLWPASSV